ncbi:MAG TPA: hypothetical protein VEY51_04455 [Chondromyces sp.]|nr:hypothetical protein [Chondromyces sp.]
MAVCDLCNGMRNKVVSCPNCNAQMEDTGRVYDYYDDYSAYMEIDLNKLVDGDPTSSSREDCAHLFHCLDCQNQIVIEFALSE